MSTTITWDNVFSATALADFDKNLVDNIFDKNILLKKFRDNQKTYTGGHQITVPVEYARGTGGEYQGHQELDRTETEITTTALYPPAYYEVDLTIARTDQLKNKGPAKILDLVTTRYNNAAKTMLYNLTSALFGNGGVSASGAQKLIGLGAQVPIDPTANPSWGNLGGIDRSVTAGAYWRNQIYNFGATVGTITMLMLQNLWGSCSDGTDHPDVIVTSQVNFDQIWSLADNKQRLGNEEAAKLGYTSIDFNNVPIVVDKACSTGAVYMLNTKYLYFKVDPEDDMRPTAWLQGTDQLVQTKYITWSGQLISANPRYQGVGYYA